MKSFNKSIPPDLVEALYRRDLVLFIGSDFPQVVTGVPGRADLARQLARRYGLDEKLPLADVAQRISQIGNRWEFTSFICSTVDTAGKSPTPFHEHIVDITQEFHLLTLITTAYDDLLSMAFRQAGVGINRVVRSSDVAFARRDRPTLIKLYGDVQQPDTLVVTDSDHLNILRDREKGVLLDELRRALSQSVVLFLGYNLMDADFRFLFDQVAESHFARTAYAVWPDLPEADVRMWRGRGIVILDADPLGFLDTPLSPSMLLAQNAQVVPVNYRRGFEVLQAQLEQTNRYSELSALKARLPENLAAEPLHGLDRQTRTEFVSVLGQLNRLALGVLGISFADLSQGKVPSSMEASVHTLSLVRELNVLPTPESIRPPVAPCLQHLPFGELSWEQFEGLCAALVEANPLTIDCHLYGAQGDDQGGIDIVASQRGAGGEEIWAYQCKRHKDYKPSQLRKAWARITYQADYHVLMLSVPAKAALRRVANAESGFFLWDANDISRKLKNYPMIVKDFFGPAWQEAFSCG